MNYVYIGDLVNTHGLKGEVRILSDFKYKETIFKIHNTLYIGKNKEKLVINSYRKHKNYDMLTFDGLNAIEDVINYKGDKVYINRDDLDKEIILDEDLIGFSVYQGGIFKGVVSSLMSSNLYTLLVIKKDDKEYLIPNISKFVLSIDFNEKNIYIIEMKGLLDED